MNADEKPVGFFDSGVGGISVLRQAIKILPNENFIYFGDSKNAPYGIKNVEEVRSLTENAVKFLLKKKSKAIVIACNTATSASIDYLREKYNDIPIVGIEPALKPAVELKRPGKIIIMATPMTLAERKFDNLMRDYSKSADIVSLPCPGLVELIEKGITEGKEVNEYLKDKLKDFLSTDIAVIVLGCTHYPFIKNELSNVTGGEVPIIDGSYGTAKQLKKQLYINNIMNTRSEKGSVCILNSMEDDDIISLCNKLLY